MLRFLTFRLLQFPLILAIIYLATFLLAWVAPGSPFEKERKLPAQTKAYLEEKFHATSATAFLAYYPAKVLTTGDFGPSLNYPEFTVNDILRKSLPVSVTLGLVAVAIALVGGVLIGTLAAVKRDGPLDWLSLSVALIGVSVPSFVAAAMLLTAFSFNLKWFPLGGWPSGAEQSLAAADSPERSTAYASGKPQLRDALDHPDKYFEFTPTRDRIGTVTGFEISERDGVKIDELITATGFDWNQLFDHPNTYFRLRTEWWLSAWKYFQSICMPAIALSLLPMAYITRLTRVSMIDVLASDYVRTARAKGLSRPAVVFRHCLRNALLPVLSFLGPAAATTLTGSFVVEKVFNIPGMGDYFVRSVLNRDQTLILGTVMIYSFFLLSLNLFVDVMYSVIDPRIQLTQGKA